jgi:hypothetical protein
VSLFDPSEWKLKVETLEQELRSVYRERAHLVAHLASLYPHSFAHTDSSTPGWPVATVETPVGQLSWHIAPEDTDVFPNAPTTNGLPWDGHSTEEKYARLQQLTAANTAGTGEPPAAAPADVPSEHPEPAAAPPDPQSPAAAAPENPAPVKEG